MTRQEFPPSVRRAALERAGGFCECGCGEPLVEGEIELDHVLADGLGGEPTLENCAVVRKSPCHSFKSRKHDVRMISDADRKGRKDRGELTKRQRRSRLRAANQTHKRTLQRGTVKR